MKYQTRYNKFKIEFFLTEEEESIIGELIGNMLKKKGIESEETGGILVVKEELTDTVCFSVYRLMGEVFVPINRLKSGSRRGKSEVR